MEIEEIKVKEFSIQIDKLLPLLNCNLILKGVDAIATLAINNLYYKNK